MQTVEWLKENKKQLLRLAAAIAILVGAGLLGLDKAEIVETQRIISAFEQNQPGLYRVAFVNDGDTITVVSGGEAQKIRMIGVDTPELHHPEKPVQCFARAAKLHTQSLVANQRVRLESDPQSKNRDVYNRLLRYVYTPDGELINARLIRDGYGFAYTRFPHSKKQAFVGLEKQARTTQRGLWNKCPITEDDYGQPQTKRE